MSTVLFKRGDMATMNATPITDGMVFFNEENDRIYMDNGNTRYQYGGDTELVSNPTLATVNNAFNANASLNIFSQKTTVVDDKNTALNVTQNYIPLGCLAFKEAIGTDDYSGVGYGSNIGTISNGLVALRGVTLSSTLAVGETEVTLQAPTLLANSYVDVYTDNSAATPITVVANDVAKTITLTFKPQDVSIGIRVIVRNMQ